LVSKLEIASILYHDVVDNPRDSGFQRPSAMSYKHTLSEFAQHLDKIATGPIAPELITDIDFSRPGRHLLLAFDDGGKSALYVSDELHKRNWKAHFFITTSLIGKRTFLNLDEIKYLQSCGHIIGSHSHTHPDIFKDLSLQKMMEEWKISCETLSQVTDTPCITASVPGGDISSNVLRSADAVGIRYLFTSEPDLRPQREGNCWILGRVCLKTRTSLSRVEELIQFRGWRRARMLRQAKVLLRTALFPLYRLYVRGVTHEWSDEK